MDRAAKTATTAIAARETQKTLQAARSGSERATAARIRSVALASYAMPELQLASFWTENRDEILTAAGTVLLAFILAEIVDRALKRRGEDELSPVTNTRLRLVRRLIFATIVVLGLGLALAQFDSIKRIATGVLASSAVLGLVVGFAARQTLANAIAGILIAITQPIRIGDLVTFQEETGEVEDIRLTYTYLRLDDGRRFVIPNEQLAQSPVFNHTVVDPRVQVAVDVWLPHGADVERALELLTEEEGVDASVAEVTVDGVRLSATTWAESARERGAVAAGLRARTLHRLREQGLSSEPAAP
jgi:small-conductance mechanosensitive channel